MAVASRLPTFLGPLRDNVAAWVSLDPEDFAMVLVNEYRPGAPIYSITFLTARS
jgi:hypothetical protein